MSTSNQNEDKYYLGVDVGTGSARAALVSSNGTIIASSTQPTTTWRSDTDARIFEQSTTEIWHAICQTTRACLDIAKVPKSRVGGIGFDATCSLAVTNRVGEPVCVTAGNAIGNVGERNVILWADHRAETEAGIINSSGAIVLDYVGGTMSLEMEIPKILWLSRHMDPEKFAQCQFFDLPDWLTYKSTGSLARSSCSLTCKCSFIPPGATPCAHGWVPDFFTQIGLGAIVQDEFASLGGWGVVETKAKSDDPGLVLTAGQPVGSGLTREAAEELGLVEGTPVGSAVIDAYAGWIGTVAARYKTESGETSGVPGLTASGERLAAVAGTSTCHVIQSPQGIFVPGVWGPYKNAVFPGWWMNEGGQSSTGQLIDFVLTTHPAYGRLQELAKEQQKSVHVVLDEKLEELRVSAGVSSLVELTKDVHFYPDLHGNRSPLADAQMRGSIVGLRLDAGLGDLALKFNVTLEAIALQTRHIIETMNARGHTVRSIFMSGGQAGNAKLMQLFADVCGVPVVLPQSHSAAVVLGAAMLGRFAAEVSGEAYGDQKGAEEASESSKEALWKIMVEMTPAGREVRPGRSAREGRLLDAKYVIFLEAIDVQRRWRKEMEAATLGEVKQSMLAPRRSRLSWLLPGHRISLVHKEERQEGTSSESLVVVGSDLGTPLYDRLRTMPIGHIQPVRALPPLPSQVPTPPHPSTPPASVVGTDGKKKHLAFDGRIEGTDLQMIPQHHIQTSTKPPTPTKPRLNLGLFRGRKDSDTPVSVPMRKAASGPSPPPKPARLKAGLLRASVMPHSPSIAAAIEFMRSEHDPKDDEHKSSVSSGPSSSVASLLSSNTGTATTASEEPAADVPDDSCDSDPGRQPRPHDPDKRVSTASSQRTLTAWNAKRESAIFAFPNPDSPPLDRLHTTDAVDPQDPSPSTAPLRQPRIGHLAGSLKRRSASMSILLPLSLHSEASSPAQSPPPLPPRPIVPAETTDSEGYMSSTSTPGRKWGRTHGIKGKIAAWTAAAEPNGRKKPPRPAPNPVPEPRRSDSPHQAQGYPYSHSPASAPALHVHTHVHLPSHPQTTTPLMSIAALAPAARDLALGVGKRVEKFYRARSSSGAGHEVHPYPSLAAMRVGSPNRGLGAEPMLAALLRPAIPGASGLLFGRSLDDPCVPRDMDGWIDETGVRRCVGLPVFVSRSIRHLERWGGDEEGLFRISGRPAHVSRLRVEFDAGADYDLSEIPPSDLDPHAVSSLFKAYLRELPDPILTRRLKHQFDLAMTATDSSSNASFDVSRLPTSATSFGESAENMRSVDDSLLTDIRELVDQLPMANYNLLHELCHLLRYTTEHAHTTKMPLANLLLLFCPTLGFSAGFLRCIVQGQDTLFQWGRLPPLPEPSSAPLPRSIKTSISTVTAPKHAPSASSVRSLKSPLLISTEAAAPRARAQTTTASAPPSRASMFFPNLGPKRPSIGRLFGVGTGNQDVQPSRHSSSSSESYLGSEEDMHINPKRITRPPRVSLDIPDGSFAPSLDPHAPSRLEDVEECSPEASAKRSAQTPIADMFRSALTAAVPTIAPTPVTVTGTTGTLQPWSPSKTLPPRLGLPFRRSEDADEMGWSRGVLDAASASLGASSSSSHKR